ncbi:MAG: bifunctional [glutamate--ammonia ligase]-adenylyl-L-tyrosine phosphorylase/[glutamate--ammonia-ligase] adenylyltransferase [Gammaproteobacteria bacterium]
MTPIRPTNLPATLEPVWERVEDRLNTIAVDAQPADVQDTAGRVAVCSDFVLTVLERQPDALMERLADREALSVATATAHFDLANCDEATAMNRLRRVRQVEMARIAWRDLSGWADLETSLQELSVLADAAVLAAIDFAVSMLEPRFGRPVDDNGVALPLLVLGMGKLGGYELNYSSDIDLVFLHPDGVEFRGIDGIDPEGYYRRVAQLVVKLLDQVTQDGFVFRVDTRLRPFGKSGPLTVGISALETYLVRHGRDWERYAYLKARLLNGSGYEEEVFDQILTPFVFRRYVDFGVFAALRQMKALIAQEVARKDMSENIKLGPGGIREIEFIVQASQLVRGGRDPALRERSLLSVLPRVVENRQLTESAAADLASGYRFLRMLENRLQAQDDQQTHHLPTDPVTRERLAFSMNEPSWEALSDRITEHRDAIEREFAAVALDGNEDARSTVTATESTPSWSAAWEASDFDAFLDRHDLDDAGEIATVLRELRDGPLYRRMDELSRQRLSAAAGRIVLVLQGQSRAARTLRRVLPVLHAVGRRSAYLALLNENPAALERLLTLASQSQFLIRLIAAYPLLLDELLDARIFDTPPSREELEEALSRNLEHVDRADVESSLEAIRQFQRTAVFRIAVADRFGRLPLMKVSDRLTDTAELILQLALDMAWRELVAKHGRPMCGVRPDLAEAGFAIIAYGKLGGLELGYGSDLDIVFVHGSCGPHQETDGESSIDNARFFARLAQRLIHFLGIQTSSGRLYEIDTRLRPSGESGFMVTSMEAFKRYQRKEAWVWEHQALLRSRSVAGAEAVRRDFEADRREVLTEFVKRDGLLEEVRRMRERMRKELSKSRDGQFDLKQDRGGLADIEFLVDYWVLSSSADHPELVEYPDNVRQLEALERVGLVQAERCQRLISIYLALRERSHLLALNDDDRVVAASEFEDESRFVTSVWDEVFGE